jgi:CheY-like chemotaxis protein
MSLHPNAILLDVILQGAEDGWQILRMLKADPLVRDIPVVLHSVIDNPERARQLGAAAVLVKPAAAGVITALLRRHSTPITPRRGAVVDAA